MGCLLCSFPAWLFFISLSRGCAPLCPVLALTNNLNFVDQVLGLSSFFRMAVLVKGPPILFLQATLQAAGIPGKFSGHSLRIGATTTAVQRGIPGHLIKTMGHWLSEAYLLYVRTLVDTILSVAGRIS